MDETTNRSESTHRRIIHFAQLITTNVIAICTRGRAKSRGPRRFIDYSSRHKWRGRAGNSGNSSAKLAPSNEPPPLALHQPSLPPVPVSRYE